MTGLVAKPVRNTGARSTTAAAAFALLILSASAQPLKITSPLSGAIVHPGDTLPVMIDSPDTKFKMVVLVSGSPFGFLGPQSALPARIDVKIPENACCRKYEFTAMGAGESADGIYSKPITVDVEPANPPTKLRSLSPGFNFRSPGGSLPVLLMADFANGEACDVTYSSRITYLSTQPEIVQVDEQGAVKAKSPGKASILVTYTQDSRKVRLTLPVLVEVGALASTAYSIAFPDEPVGATAIERTVRLASKTLGPIKIVKIATTGDYSETDDCAPAPLPRGGSCSIRVKFTPRDKGDRKGELTIYNDFSGDGLVISLDGTGQ
jgi:hypothetical protein